MKELCLLIQKKTDRKEWHPIHLSRRGPGLSHLLFVNDVLLFASASVTQARVIRHTLIEFYGATGMMVNT